MRIDEIHYRDSLKKYKKCSNEELIMKSLLTLIQDIDNLKHPYQRHDADTRAILEVLSNRTQG